MVSFAPFLLVAVTMAAARPQIYGGTEVKLGEIPFQVSLQLTEDGEKFMHLCGGSIYNKSTIITAAHCADEFAVTQMQVVTGQLSLAEKEKTEQIRKVKSKHVHPLWDANRAVNDIALLVLEEELEFNEFVGPVEIPSEEDSFEGSATVSGWGVTAFNPFLPSDALLKVTIPLIPSLKCLRDYEFFPVHYDSASMVCAGTLGKGGCFGDSGGPLICGSKLCGIVSWGRECGSGEFPGVFARVTSYVSFIKSG